MRKMSAVGNVRHVSLITLHILRVRKYILVLLPPSELHRVNTHMQIGNCIIVFRPKIQLLLTLPGIHFGTTEPVS